MNKNPRILLVEDDKIFGSVVRKHLEETGYRVEHCINGKDAWEQFQKTRFDVCLLDIVVPGMNGFQLAKHIREKNTLVPIIFFSSEKTEEKDRIECFDIGADAYLTKPFSIMELLRRIRVFLKYSRPLRSELLIAHNIGNLTFHYRKLKIIDNAEKITVGKLSPLEARVMRYFFSRPNTVIRREELLVKVWGKVDFSNGRSMDVFVTKLRKQVRTHVPQIELETLHNMGLRLKVPDGVVIEKVTVPLQNVIK
ncbi:response regulator transcription factor [Chitinophaga vietnamensis]|uniref:response regulator transcription factor n=1 Tax=Chitinophaga vietnamensis TaxID=2593957 RepID=UPI0011784EF1|nr:response regulator transcription factor [Chitinophaga vietnamensis]